MQAVATADDGAFDRLEAMGLVVHPRDVARFHRPTLAEFHDESSPVFMKDAEFHRWYEMDGSVRPRPLDFDELAAVLIDLCGYDVVTAEWIVAFESRAKPGDCALWERVMHLYGPDLAAAFEAEEGTLLELSPSIQ